MGTHRMTEEIADPRGQHFEAVETQVNTGYIGRHQVMKVLALDQQMTRPTSHCRRTLRAAAVVLALLVALLSAGCAQGPVVPADPTATYVPPPTATLNPTVTPVSANQRF